MIIIGVLRERFAYWNFVDCLDKMREYMHDQGTDWACANVRSTNIFKGREKIVHEFLSHPTATHLLFIDSDQTFAPETAVHMHNVMLRNNLPILSGVVFRRAADCPEPCIYRRTVGTLSISLARELKGWFDKYDPPVTFEQPTILKDIPDEEAIWEIDECGTGCIMIRRDVFEKTPRPWFQGMGPVGTDLAFCRRARRHGFDIFADLRVQLGHIREYQITSGDFRAIGEWVPVEKMGMETFRDE